MLTSRVDLAGVTRALECGYDLSQIAIHLHVHMEELEVILAALKRRSNKPRCVRPRTYAAHKSAAIALTEYRNLYWFDGCRHCGGDLYVEDDEIKCLACSRALAPAEQAHLLTKYPKEQQKLVERMKDNGR